MKIFGATTLLVLISLWGQAQNCGSNVPSFTINLSGSPDSVWTSPVVNRLDTCCGASSPDRCVKFVVMLDDQAYGIKLDIIRGTISGGSPYYQVNCGTPTPLGDVMCLSGSGPHSITFCYPLVYKNEYQITSISKPDITDSISITESCPSLLSAKGYIDSTITWTSTPFDSTSNTFLSCTKGCDSTWVDAINPLQNPVYYKVCGVLSSCASTSSRYCDSVKVEFIAGLKADINPDSPKACFGMSSTPLTANPSGGKVPHYIEWRLIDSTWVDSIRTLPGEPGKTYVLKVFDSTGCPPAFDTVYVDSFSAPIVANAGLDQSICKSDSVVWLSGSIQNALGGRWTGGKGVFMPHDSSLKAIYQPSAGELSNGAATLLLSTYGNHNCPGQQDGVTILLMNSPAPEITGDDSVCLYSTSSYSAMTSTGSLGYTWSISGGIITGYSKDSSSVAVQWTDSLNNRLWVTEVYNSGCTGSDSMSIHVFGRVATSIVGSDSLCSNTATTTFRAIPYHPNRAHKWTITNASVQSSARDSMVANLTSSGIGNSIVTLYLIDSAGCSDTVTTNLRINPSPDTVITGPDTVCELTTTSYVASAGVAHVWSVTNGTIISGSGTDSVVVNWPGKNTSHSISVVITNALGCSSMVTKNVTVNPKPDSVLNGPDTICELSSADYSSATGSTYLWAITNGTIASGLGNDSIRVNWPRKNTRHHLSVTVTNQYGCTSHTAKLIVINSKPDSVINGPDTLCELSSALYDASAGTSHSWSVTNGTIISSQNNDTISVNWPQKNTHHELVVIITNQLGCRSTINKEVVINSRPDSVIGGPDTLCELSVANYTAPAGTVYSWSITNGSIVSGSGTDSISVNWPQKNTHHELAVIITNQFGCTGVGIKAVTINSKPYSEIFGPDTLCELSLANYLASAGTSHSWAITNGSITRGVGSDSIAVGWPRKNTSHKLDVTITNQYGCTGIASKNVTLLERSDSLITGPDTVCELSSAQYSADDGAKHYWEIDGGTFSSSDSVKNVSVDWLKAGNEHSLRVLISNSNGCITEGSKDIFIQTLPMAIIQGIDTACINGGDTLEFESASKASDYTYTWLAQNLQIVSGAGTALLKTKSPDKLVAPISLRITDSLGCTSDTSHSIAGLSFSGQKIIGVGSVCNNEAFSYYLPYPLYIGMSRYTVEWQVSGGNIIENINDSLVTVQWDTIGSTGAIVVSLRNKYGCDTVLNKPIIKLQAPNAEILGPDTVCAFDTRTFGAQSQPSVSYQWDVTGGEIVGNRQTAIDITWLDENKGSIKLDVANNKTDCSARFEKEITISDAPTPTISGEERICPNDNRQIYFTPKKINTLYTWTATNGEVDSIIKPHKVEINWHEREGLVKLYAVNELTGCDTTLSKTVKMISSIEATPLDPEMCDLNDLAFSASSNDPDAQFQWDMGDGSDLIAGSSIKYRYRKRGSYTVKMIAYSFNECWDTLFTTVTIHKKPKAYFEYYGSNDPIWEKRDTVFFVDKSVNAISWEWSFHDSIRAHDQDTWHVYDRLGNHPVWLKVASNKGCVDSIERIVEVLAPVSIIPPNAFSPNGDSTNDYFYIPSHHIAELNIKIFNRWGEQIYESNDLDFRWDGRFMGEAVQEDIYFWIVSARDVFKKPIYLQGSVMVIK